MDILSFGYRETGIFQFDGLTERYLGAEKNLLNRFFRYYEYFALKTFFNNAFWLKKSVVKNNIHQQPYDAIHCSAWASFPVAKMFNKPVVLDTDVDSIVLKPMLREKKARKFFYYYPFISTSRIEKIMHDAEMMALTEAALITTNSEEQKKIMINMGIPSEKIYVVWNSSDVDRFRSVPKGVWGKRNGINKKICIFLGDSDFSANLHALQLMHSLSRLLPDILFIHIGGDVYKKDNFIGLGRLPEDEFIQVLRSAHIALAPLKIGSGLKTKVVDYLAAEIPVVTTPVGLQGLEEFRDIFSVAEFDENAFAHSISRLIKDDIFYQQLVNSISKLGAEFNYKNNYKIYHELYDKVVSTK